MNGMYSKSKQKLFIIYKLSYCRKTLQIKCLILYQSARLKVIQINSKK